MDLPELKQGEKGLIKSPGVQIKGVPFNAFLTSERIILRALGGESPAQKDIPIDTIESVEPRESDEGDPLLELSVFSSRGEIKRMIIAFVQEGGQARKDERDRWVLKVTERRVSAQAWEKDTETKEKKARDPNAKPTFHDGIHMQKQRGDTKSLKGDLNFITADRARSGKRETISFRDNGVSDEDLTGKSRWKDLPLIADDDEPKKTQPPPVKAEKPRPAWMQEPYEEPLPIQKHEQYEEPAESPSISSSLPAEGGFFCNRCGNRVPSGSVFCNRCGSKVVAPGNVPASLPTEPSEPFDIRTFPVEPIQDKPIYSVPEKKPAKEKRSGSPKFSLGGIFRRKPKKQKEAPIPPPERPVKKPSGRRRFAPSKKMIGGIVAVVAIIAVAGGLFMFGGTLLGSLPSLPSLPGGNGSETTTPAATPTTATSGTSAQATATGTVVVATRTPLVIPSDNVYIRVDYLGAWSGAYGTSFDMKSVRNSGERMYGVENPNSTIIAGFKKEDESTHPLTVEIYKNGQIVKSGTTTDRTGMVNITADM